MPRLASWRWEENKNVLLAVTTRPPACGQVTVDKIAFTLKTLNERNGLVANSYAERSGGFSGRCVCQISYR
jgi:hypothetical protein